MRVPRLVNMSEFRGARAAPEPEQLNAKQRTGHETPVGNEEDYVLNLAGHENHHAAAAPLAGTPKAGL